MLGYFSTLDEFLKMNGYAKYVWPALGVTLALLGCYALLAFFRLRWQLKKLRQNFLTRDDEQEAEAADIYSQ